MNGLYQAYKQFQKDNGKTTYFWMVSTKNTTQIAESNLPSAYIGERFYVFYCEASEAYVMTTWNIVGNYMQKFNEEGLELALNSLDGDFINEFDTRINITVRDIKEEQCVYIAKLFGENGEIKKLEEGLFQITLDTAARISSIMRYLMRIIYDGKLNAYQEYAYIKEKIPSHLTIEVA
ncbi:hypothetical protein ACOMCU_01330 [Lysinibacillus sp. UGB7]|uniref:hypothetical protein n=1 Tax=Lysinibacillus sp. UGB7 TaxID=3411039 RepID=UPI003B807499